MYMKELLMNIYDHKDLEDIKTQILFHVKHWSKSHLRMPHVSSYIK